MPKKLPSTTLSLGHNRWTRVSINFEERKKVQLDKDSNLSDQGVFSINGIEIDLKGLEELEKRVAAKKALKNEKNCVNDPSTSSCCQIDSLNKEFDNKLVLSKTDDEPSVAGQQSENADRRPGPSLATSYLIIMALFSILNQIYYRQLKNTS